MAVPKVKEALKNPVIRSTTGGIMVMDSDPVALGTDEMEKRVVTARPPRRTNWKRCGSPGASPSM